MSNTRELLVRWTKVRNLINAKFPDAASKHSDALDEVERDIKVLCSNHDKRSFRDYVRVFKKSRDLIACIFREEGAANGAGFVSTLLQDGLELPKPAENEIEEEIQDKIFALSLIHKKYVMERFPNIEPEDGKQIAVKFFERICEVAKVEEIDDLKKLDTFRKTFHKLMAEEYKNYDEPWERLIEKDDDV